MCEQTPSHPPFILPIILKEPISQLLPRLSVGVSHFYHTLSSPGYCHVPGPTELRGFKQERQHLSDRLACPRRHMP